MAASDASDAQEVRCWKVFDGSPPQVAQTATGAACAVDVAFPLVSARFLPNESIPVFWTVRLLSTAQSSNELKMKLPPVKTITTSADNFGNLVQITETNVRVCSSRDKCDPMVAGLAASTLQSGDFPTSSGSVLFQSVGELRLAKEGTYVLAAQVRIVDDRIPTVSYYYAAFSEVTVATTKRRTPVLDKRTTYCRRSAQDALATVLDASMSLAESSSCELQIAVDSPDVAQPSTPIAISWNATLVRDTSKDIRLPSPLMSLESALDGKSYEIVSSTIKICKKGVVQCDEYSSVKSSELETTTGATVLFGNFTNNVATFRLDALTLPSTGTFTAFAHVVLSGGSSRRFDVTTYFPIVVTAENAGAQVSTEQYSAGDDSFYCWQAVGLANATAPVATSSVLAMGKSAECPYTVAMSMSPSSSLTTADSVTVTWTVKQQISYAATKFGAVNLTTVRDTKTDSFVNIPQSAVYMCASDALCTPFSANRELVFAARATNLTDATTSFTASNISFKTAGNYTLFVHVVMPNGNTVRFDSAAFARLAVTVPVVATSSSSGSNVGTIIGVIAGVIGGALLVLFAVVFTRRYLARQRRPRVRKEPVFAFRSHTMESPERIPTDSRDSIASDASGTFMYVKAAPSPSPLDNMRANSLSYDPFARPSFPDVPMDDGNYTFSLPDDSELPPTATSTRQL